MNNLSSHPLILSAMREHRFDLARHEQGHCSFDRIVRIAGFQISISVKLVGNAFEKERGINGQASGDAHKQSGLSGSNFIRRHFNRPRGDFL